MSKSILDSPCIFCGYNGPGYFQKGTHDASCIFFSIGGAPVRGEYLDNIASTKRELWKHIRDLEAQLARVRELPGKWRKCEFADPERAGHDFVEDVCADELEAALKESG